MKNIKYWIDLQRFEDGEATAENGQENNKTPQENKPSEEKKYTDSDIDRIIGQKFARWQQQQEKQFKDRTEAEKLAKMTEDEKNAHKIAELEKKLQAAEAKEQRNSMAAVARTALADSGVHVSDEILDYLVKDSAESTKAAVQSFVTAFNKAVDAKVKEALKGRTPMKASKSGNNMGAMTKEKIMAVQDRKERQRLINANIDLFKKKG